jgi:cell fate (sporulation/competence/biofilm development) regulator YlbF (YheA/YmcA/DUF963 family)
MATTDQVLESARQVGKLVSEHPAIQKLQGVVEQLQKDIDAQRAMADFERFVATIHQKEQSGQPIEVADKRKLEELQRKVVTNRLLRDFQMAQIDVLDLRRKIDEAIFGSEEIPAGPGAAAGSPLTDPGLKAGDF